MSVIQRSALMSLFGLLLGGLACGAWSAPAFAAPDEVVSPVEQTVRDDGLEDDDTELEILWSGSIMAKDPSRPLITDFKAFEAFFKGHWDVTGWRFEDWRDSQTPSYRFEVSLNAFPGLSGLSVHGSIPPDGRLIQFDEDGCEYFTVDFVRRFVSAYPDQVDNILFFNENGDVSRLEPDLDDAELLARIRLDKELPHSEVSALMPDPSTRAISPDAPVRMAATADEMKGMSRADLLNENALLLLAWKSVWPPSHDGDMTAYTGASLGPWPNVEKPAWQKPLEVSRDQQVEMARKSALLRLDDGAGSDEARRDRVAQFLRLAFPDRFGRMSRRDLDDWVAVRFEEAKVRGFGDDEAVIYWPVLAAIGGEGFADLNYVNLWLQIEYLSRDDLLDRLLKSANVTLQNPWIACLVKTVVETPSLEDHDEASPSLKDED